MLKETRNEMLQKNDFFREYIFNIENLKITMVTRDAVPSSKQKKRYSPMHTHANYEIICSGAEEQIMMFGEKSIMLNLSDVIIVSPNVLHKFGNVSGCGLGLQFDISPNGAKGSLDIYGMLTELVNGDYTIISNCPEVGNLIYEIDKKEECGDVLSIGRLFYDIIVRLINATNLEHRPSATTQQDSDSLRKYKIQTLVHHSFMRDVFLEEIADVLHLSTRQASRIIKEYFGCTFKEFVVKMRMEKTADLLVNSDLSIIEIAQNVGYSSIRGFYTSFKNYYGCLPLEYRISKQK